MTRIKVDVFEIRKVTYWMDADDDDIAAMLAGEQDVIDEYKQNADDGGHNMLEIKTVFWGSADQEKYPAVLYLEDADGVVVKR